MRADDFLAGPRGRAVCLAYSGLWPGRWELIPDSARSPFESLADATTRAMYWQDPEDYDLAGLPTDAAAAVRRAAAELAAHADTAWWDSPAPLGDQHAVEFELDGRSRDEPRLTGLRAGIEHFAERPDDAPAEHRDAAGQEVDWRITSGAWWSAPIVPGGVRTTRAAGPDLQPVGLACVEDELGWQRADTRPIGVIAAPRLCELADPADWVRLCRDYPLDVSTSKRGDWWRATGRDGAWVMPNWPAVARDWDAVHLTVRGYLTTAGRALDVDDQRATVLAGWDPDATFWLNDVLRSTGDATRWQRDQDGEWRRLVDS